MATSKTRKPPAAPSPIRDASIIPFEVKDWQAIALLVLLLAVFFRDILLGNAFLWEDFLYHDYPSRNFAAISMATGELPLWNPYTFNGMPFLADIQKSVFYLPCMLLTPFVSGGVLHPFWLELMIVAHYLLAGIGMFYLARSFELRRSPSLFAAATYMLSGFMVTHAIHQYIITLAAWYPLVLLLFRKALAGGWKWVFLGGVALGHSTLAGFPQLSLYFYSFLFVYFAFELLTVFRLRELLSRPALAVTTKAAALIVISVGIAMVQLFPTVEFADFTFRAQITYQKATEGQFSWSQLITFLYPKFFGSAGATGYNYHGPGTYWNFWETCMYFGVLPLMLMLMSLAVIRKSKYVAFFWVFGVFALLFALGGNGAVHRLFFDLVPGFNKFRNPARMGVFLTFGGALLAAFSLQHILYDSPPGSQRRRMRSIMLVCAGLSLIIFLAILSGSLTDMFPFMKDAPIFSDVKGDALSSFAMTVLSAGLLSAALHGSRLTRWAGPAAVALLFIDMLIFGGNQNNSKTNPLDYFNQSRRLVEYIRQDSKGELVRVNMRNQQGMLMDRNQGLMDRVFLMEGYTPLVLQRYLPPSRDWSQLCDMMNAKYRVMANEQNRSLTLARVATYLPRAYMVYHTRVMKDSASIFNFMKGPQFEPSHMAVVEEELASDTADTSLGASWTANFTSYRLNTMSLNVSTPRDGYLVFSEIYYPGWNAYIDGESRRVYRANWNQRLIPLEAGIHQVELRYEPASFRNGMWITVGTLALCAAGVLVPALRRMGARGVRRNS